MSTPPPVYVANDLRPGPGERAQYMQWGERARIREAARRARILHPGIIGEVLSAELLSWEEIGIRLGNGAPMYRLVEHLMAIPVPPKPHLRVTAGLARPSPG